ncbi:hypothetical protein [Amycolatopsis speibonae]|uniref:Uncharacterized protein n=1 Tax=Amycolatopsis speibonae TaxID=1450224 RepID=A0ABV7NT28_9PSEU
MDTPPGQNPRSFQQQPDAPPTVVSVSGPMDPVPGRGRTDHPEPRRLVAASLTVLASVLVLVGCFFPFFTTEYRLSFDRSDKIAVVVQGAWDTKILQRNDPAFVMGTSPVGVPLLVAAVILLAAAIAAARAARLRRPGTLDRWLTTIAAVFLIGVVSTVAMLGIGRQLGAPAEGTLTLDAGMWALFAAAAAAAGAAVMTHRVQADEVPVSDPSLADMPTPKDGISITMLPPEPQPELPDYSAFAPPPETGSKVRD